MNKAVAAMITVFFAGISFVWGSDCGELVCRKNSLYTGIFVYQNGSIATLRFGLRSASVQSQVDINNPRQHLLEYTAMSFCGLLYNPEPDCVLVLGQGGGVIPREMHYYYPNAVIDVVEIDGEIPSIAEKYFGFKPDDKLQVHIDDGRMFIKKKLLRYPGNKYDYIVLDAFNGDYIPFHLMTSEFLQEVKEILSEDGVVVANVFSSNRLFDAELKTFLAVFGHCQVYMGKTCSNAMLVSTGSNKKYLTVDEALNTAEKFKAKSLNFDMTDIAQRLTLDIVPSAKAAVLTDDRAPVNWLKTQK